MNLTTTTFTINSNDYLLLISEQILTVAFTQIRKRQGHQFSLDSDNITSLLGLTDMTVEDARELRTSLLYAVHEAKRKGAKEALIREQLEASLSEYFSA